MTRLAEGSETLGFRLAIWRDALSIFRDFPVTGTGLNTFGAATLVYQTANRHMHFQEAHNEYLQLLAEGGLLLAIPIVVAVAALVRGIVRRFRTTDDPEVYLASRRRRRWIAGDRLAVPAGIQPADARQRRAVRGAPGDRAAHVENCQPDDAMILRSRQWIALHGWTLWIVPAALNMSAGVALATHPNRWADLQTIRRWTGQWLFTGKDLYASASSGTDYPPHAIVALSPLSLLPQSLAVPMWAMLNIALAALAGYLAARFVRPRVSRGDAVYFTLLFLSWSGTKTLLQFSLLTLVFGLAAVVLAEKRPAWSGVCLGLSLMKPQIALPFLLWTVFRRRWTSAVIAILVVAAGTALFCLRASANPLNVAIRYAQILQLYFNGEIAMQGIAQLRPLFAQSGGGAGIELATAAILLPLLAMICVEGFRTTNSASRVMYLAPGLAGIWSLLTFYHLTYGFVVLLPIAAVLLLDEDDESLNDRRIVFWTLQLALMIDVPGAWRRFGGAWSHVPIVDAVFANFDRFVMLFLFAAVVVVYRRHRAPAPGLAPVTV